LFCNATDATESKFRYQDRRPLALITTPILSWFSPPHFQTIMSSDKKHLYEAFEQLHPREYFDVPLDHLDKFLTQAFSAAELIVNSVPGPPGNKDSDATSIQSFQSGKLAENAAGMPAQSVPPPTLSPAHEDLQTHWGKPLKLSPKENPLNLSLYKLPPHDKRGAWFARRSIHHGLPFDKWKKAMQREFAESLAVEGGPGAGAIRGIGVDKRLERQVLPGIGKMEVFLLSAQFPGPTSPRDFVTLLLTTEGGLSDSSVPHNGHEKTNGNIPRHYIVVSIPVDHPDAPLRSGYVRGQYESVEMIRELPAAASKSWSTNDLLSPKDAETKTRDRGSTISLSQSSAKSDAQPEDKLVEWIMITRSDPGGGIPRFMVERGTPGSIAADAVKFLDWATSQEDFPEEEEKNITSTDNATEPPKEDQEVTKPVMAPLDRRISNSATFEPSRPTDTGVISALTSVAREGYDRLVPTMVQNSLDGIIPRTPQGEEEEEVADDSTDISSLRSFASAEQFVTAPEGEAKGPDVVLSSSSSFDQKSTSGYSERTALDKRLARIEEKRAKLEAEHNKSVSQLELKAQDSHSKDDNELIKTREKFEREKKKREEKHAKELDKLEKKKENEERRAEEKRRKAEEGDSATRLKRERDQSRRMAEVLRKESGILRERMGELQRENTLLVAKVAKIDGGKAILKEVQDEMHAPS
jgi:hypothetical protein